MKILLVTAILTFSIIMVSCQSQSQSSLPEPGGASSPEATNKKTKIDSEHAFIGDGLSTDTSKISIPFDEILDGGPGKDGIPAIHSPSFLSQSDAESDMNYLSPDDEGVVVTSGDDARFYSFDILVWHEIVNDTFGEDKVSVTFCPLCGSSIVYDRMIDGEEVRFGVSGKLYNSNLLMYDDLTESLWSQSIGEAVVGGKLGTELKLYPSDIMNYGTFQTLYPDGTVLSDKTGEFRIYGKQPYGNYAEDEHLVFPVNHEDVRLHRKEILYIVNDGDTSVAFVRAKLVEEGVASIEVDGTTYTATYDSGKTSVTNGDQDLPGYHEMFFSWITHNQNSKSIWGVK